MANGGSRAEAQVSDLIRMPIQVTMTSKNALYFRRPCIPLSYSTPKNAEKPKNVSLQGEVSNNDIMEAVSEMRREQAETARQVRVCEGSPVQ